MATGTIPFTTTAGGTGYCKLADGTMVCYANNVTVTGNGNMAQIGSSGVYFGTVDIDFPAAFKASNIAMSGTARYSTGNGVAFGVSSTTASGATIHVYDFYARSLTDGNLKVSYIAIGRWK